MFYSLTIIPLRSDLSRALCLCRLLVFAGRYVFARDFTSGASLTPSISGGAKRRPLHAVVGRPFMV
jgi:hypothetical protein